MKEEEMLYCLIAFILGWLVSRQMGNGFSVGGQQSNMAGDCDQNTDCISGCCVTLLGGEGKCVDTYNCENPLQ